MDKNFELIIDKLQSLTVTIYNSVRRLPEVDLPSHNDPANRNQHDMPSDDEDFDNPSMEGSGDSEDDDNYHGEEDGDDDKDNASDTDADEDEEEGDENFDESENDNGQTSSHPNSDHTGVSIDVVNIPRGYDRSKGKSASSILKVDPLVILVTCSLLVFMVER